MFDLHTLWLLLWSVLCAAFAAVVWFDLRDLRSLLQAAARLEPVEPVAPPAAVRPPPHGGWPTVDVIIPIFNMGDSVAATIQSVERSAYPRRRLIVVDDGSDDGTTWPALQRLSDRIDSLERIAHGGKATAANRGVQLGDGEFVFFLDADSHVAPDFIERALAEFSPAVGAIDFVQRVSNPRQSFWTRQATFERAVLALRPDNFGALFAMRREVAQSHPFVECLSPQFEINTRLREAGLLRISPAALVYSQEPADVGLTFRRKRRWTYGFLETLSLHGRAPDFHIFIPLIDLLLIALLLVSPLQPALAVFAAGLYLNWTLKAMVLARRLGLPLNDVPGHGVYMLVVNAAVAAGLLAFWRRRRVVWR
jgi:cellulose synthase/poly-beta-1,6-N-acetylglucosamine synthase-like glycosyltransferase